MCLHASVGLAFALGFVALGSTEASARGRSKGAKVDYSSYAALTVKSHPPRSAKGNPAAWSIADLAPFGYQASWKNSRF
jgi:hypothetical protein